MDSPSTPQGGRQQERSASALRPINNLTEQLQGCTISKPKKREQTTATPASQARPRTQRRTGQENTPEGAAAAGTCASGAADSSVTPSRLNCIAELQEELSCSICLEICVRPCATPCGHAFCRACLRLALQHKRQCPKCRAAVPPTWQPKVNVALWNTIQLLFPKHAAAAPPATPLAPPAAAAAAAAPAGGRASRAAAQRQSRSEMLAAAASGGVFAANESAARQSFRPPRPAAASQPDGRSMRQQQQFLMQPDLQYLMQSMSQGSGNGSRQSQPQQRSQQPPARSTRPRQSNPFANVAQRTQTSQDNESSNHSQDFIGGSVITEFACYLIVCKHS
ncbi:hypothetical protein OEZ85_008883 [Tetradesmus obliquus]|uniref:RING-type E3 ubiquitin transferase n=1 Tax=Tetradesmus obliquus TaxID=3088 RepID=A0ABY8TM34_TETOB|nr:hypothetical protein OEZ85_008883 [Tetradesmus obliquus]